MSSRSERPPPRAARTFDRAYIGNELFLFGLCLLVVLASMLLQPSDDAVFLFGWKVPPLCVWQNLLNRQCLGCGMTRAFTYMGHGDIVGAFRVHKAGPAVFLLVAAQVPLRAWNAWKLWRA